jgi:putative oxidoreductase
MGGMSLHTSLGQKLHKPNAGLLALRLAFGLFIMVFGVIKLLGWKPMFAQVGAAMDTFGIHSHHVVWGFMCALVESVGGLLVILGLWFRVATLLLFCNMVVACSLMWHGGPDTTSSAALGAWMGGFGMPFAFGVAFLAMMLLGPGRFALDNDGGL